VITVSFTGTATAHANANDATTTITFNNSAFVGNSAVSVGNSVKLNYKFDFNDPASIAYTGLGFTESSDNDGSVTGSIIATITGDTFINAGGTLTNPTHYTLANVPAGLTPSIAVNASGTIATLTLTGNASTHTSTSSVISIDYSFIDGAFTNTATATNILNAVNASSSKGVTFGDATLTYGTSTFTESIANDGSITNTATTTLNGGVFRIFTGSFSEGVDYTTNIATVAPGLSLTITANSTTTATVTLSGNATTHANAQDVANLTITWLDQAFDNGFDPAVPAANITNYNKSDFVVNFADQASIAYTGTGFTESAVNDGSVAGSIIATITGDTFTNAGGTLTSATHYNLANVPTGLTPVINVNASGTIATLTLTGSSTLHTNAQDVASINFTFLNSAFTNTATATNVTNATGPAVSNLGVDFGDAVLTYSASTFTESISNNGTISNTETIALTGDTFVAGPFSPGVHYNVSNVPTGLTAVVTRTSATTTTLTFSGIASPHIAASSTGSTTLVFTNGAFTSVPAANITNSTKSDIAVNFTDGTASLAFSGGFTESGANDGSVTGSIEVVATGDEFVNPINSGVQVTVSNVPTGLTPVITRNSGTSTSITLTGNAIVHTASSSISNLTVTFNNGAFAVTSPASLATNNPYTTGTITFSDKGMGYSTTTLAESSANNGAVSTVVTATLSSETFVVSGGVMTSGIHYSIANVPSGMTEVVTGTSGTTATIALTGTTTPHIADVTNLQITWLNAAFTGNNATAVAGANGVSMTIDFLPAPVITYGGAGFTESNANDGGVTGSITATLTGATYALGLSISDVSVVGVPAGLTAVLTRTSGTVATLTLTGSSTSHLNADDVANITFNFADTAFNSVAAVDITNATGPASSLLGIDFTNPATITYSGSFAENGSNDGTVSGGIFAILSGDTYAATIASGTQVLITNVPPGLTATTSRISGNVVEITLTGTSTAHANVDDVANLTIAFQNGAFANTALATNVSSSTKSNGVVDFADPSAKFINYDTATFTEAPANNGTIANILSLTLTGDTFTTLGVLASTTYYTASGTPAGLTSVVTVLSSTTATVALSGTAASHTSANNIANLGITFTDAVFTGASSTSVTNYSKQNIIVHYSDPTVAGSLAYDTLTFTESSTLDGSIGNGVVVTLTGDTFSTSTGTFTLGVDFTATNTPAGLTPVITLASSTEATISFTGNAGTHTNAEDIANFGIAFNDSAFTTGPASAVSSSTISNFIVDFGDASIAYSGAGFVEAIANDGSVTGSIIATITGATWNGALSATDVTLGNAPAGLTAVLTLNTATTSTLTFTGTSTSHLNADDVADITFTFADTAFSTTTAANVAGAVGASSVLGVDFLDPNLTAVFTTSATSSPENIGGNLPTITVSGVITTSIQTIEVSRTGGTASTSVDYTFPTNPATVVIPVGNYLTPTVFAVPGLAIINDASAESAETITFGFGTVSSGVSVGSASTTTYTITDDDTVNGLVVEFATSTYSATEAGGVLAVTVTVSNASTTSLLSETATLVYTDITAASTTDYGTASTTLTIPAGDYTTPQTITVNVPITDDSILEGNETFQIVIGAVGNENSLGSIVGTVATTTATITDDETATVAFTSASQNTAGDENATTTVFAELTLTKTSGAAASIATGKTITVQAALSGTATTSDITFTSPQTLTFTDTAVNGATSSLTYTLNDDSVIEGSETAIFALSLAGAGTLNSASQVSLGATTTHTLTINDDDGLVAVFTNATSSSAEASGTNLPSITVSGADTTLTGVQTVEVTRTGGTATNNVDYAFPTNPITIVIPAANYAIPTVINVPGLSIIDDASAELAETIIFGFGATSTGVTIGSASTTTYTITDDDSAAISYSTDVFSEAATLDGSIATTSTITLTGDTFSGVNPRTLSDGIDYTSNIATVAPGLTMTIVTSSSTQATVTLVGTATSHANVNDVANLQIAFQNAAFTTGPASAVASSTVSNLAIDFGDATIIYTGTGFTETATNTGEVSGSIIATITGSTFSNAGGTLASTTDYSLVNLPSGLVPSIAVNGAGTIVTLTLSGTAGSHANVNDVSDIQFTFLNSAFSTTTAANVSGAVGASSNLGVDFDDPTLTVNFTATTSSSTETLGTSLPTITVSGADTTLTGVQTIEITQTGGTATLGTDYSFPTNPITIVIPAADYTSGVVLTIPGLAIINDINVETGETIIFGFGTASAGVTIGATTTSTYTITDDDTASIAWSGSFTETGANAGAVSGSVTATLTGDSFNTTIATTSQVTVAHVPTGLNAVATRNSSTSVTFTLVGTSTSHALANSIANLTFTFNNGAFVNTATATSVTNYSATTSVTFNDPSGTPFLNYNTATLNEVVANDGTITDTLALTLSGDTFTTIGALNGTHYSTSGVPAGLAIAITTTSSTTATVSVTGTASAHANANDATSTITFLGAAFTGASSTIVTNYSKVVSFNFNDPGVSAALTFGVTTFTEDVGNTGAVTATTSITLSGDTFVTGLFVLGTHFTTVGVPAGLTPVITRNSATSSTLSFTGTASPHTATSSATSSISFLTAAFASSTANNVSGNGQLVTINFTDSAGTLTYATSTFSESLLNNGAMSNSITATLTGTTFAATGTLTQNVHYTIANVPTGLTASLSTTATGLVVTLGGSATTHTNASDIANLTITFLNAAFTNGVATNVSGYSKSDIAVDFFDINPSAISIVATGIGQASTSAPAIFTVSLDQVATSTINFTLTLANITTTGADYTDVSGAFTIPAGSSTRVISVPVVNDADLTDETFLATISAVSGGISIISAVATGTIISVASTPTDTDNDTVPDSTEENVSFNADGDINNDGTQDALQPLIASLDDSGTLQNKDLGIVVSGASCSSLTDLSSATEASNGTSDSSYDYPAGFASFEVTGCTTGGTITVDAYFGGITSTAGLVLRKYIGGAYVTVTNATFQATTINGVPTVIATYQVTDNGAFDANPANGVIADPIGLGITTVNWSSSASSVSESSVGAQTITASIPAAIASHVVVSYSVSGTANGSDYTDTTSGTFTIPAGQTSASATITLPADDSTDESNETVILTITGVTNAAIGGTSAHTLTITDNDTSSSGGGGGGGGASYFCSDPLATNYKANANPKKVKNTVCKYPKTATSTPVTNNVNPNQLSCSATVYLKNPVKFNGANNPEDVMLLEKFLNTYENTNLPVDGIYSAVDRDVVIRWQEKYASEILTPWGFAKGTGYVFTTSLAKIKKMHEAKCATQVIVPVVTAPVTLPATTPSTNQMCYVQNGNLTRGNEGEQIMKLQNILKTLGFMTVAPNGFFGPSTESAVINFQRTFGITQTGTVGPMTGAKLTSLTCK
jgi:hypothetical protein